MARYEIVKHLAAGGMADVFLARTRGIEGWERYVVVKRIRAEQARDATYVAMFLDEARLAAALHHQNIAQVNDLGEEAGTYFFAMDYIHGEDLRRVLAEVSRRGARVPLEHVVAIATAVAAGLHHAHEQRGADRAPLGIVHRDVSPANVLVGFDGGVKVVDFGIAKAAARTQTQTRSGVLKGKVAYMSPEQCLGREVDRRSDVFALGIVLYELATTRRLFKLDNDFLTMSAIVKGAVPSPRALVPELPAMLEAIILRALARDPGDRFATADDLRRALERFATSHGLNASATALADYMRELFGDKPEPWLAPDAAAVEEDFEEYGIDFDGSASGIANAPSSGVHEDIATSAPLGRARARAASTAPPTPETPRAMSVTAVLPAAPPTPDPIPSPDAAATPPMADASPRATSTATPPMAEAAPVRVAPVRAVTMSRATRRRRAIAAALGGVAAVVISLAIVASSSARTSSPAPVAATPAPAAITVAEPPTATSATPAPAPTPAPTTSVPTTPAPTPPSASTSTINVTSAIAPAAKKKPVARATKPKHWDPNALFPQ